MIEWWHIASIVVAQVFAAGAVYGAIRADLRNLHERLARTEQQIDNLILRSSHA